MTHQCHAHGCTKTVPPRMFMCLPHWKALPRYLQAAIWRHYVPGQEQRKNPSRSYMTVQRMGVAHSAFRAHDYDATAGYLAEALSWQKRAIDAGEPDPLKNLLELK